MARYRYMESIHRKGHWDHDGKPDQSARAALKEAFAEFGRWPHMRPRPQYANVDEVKSWSDDMSSGRPGRNIEDVEQDAMDHLIRPVYEYDLWKSPLQNIRQYLHTCRAPKGTTPEEVIRATTDIKEGAGTIDPITNRRVPQAASRTAGGSEPLQSTSTVQSETTAGTSFTPKYEDLDEYGPVKDGMALASKAREAPSDSGKYGPVRWNEPDGRQPKTPEENSKKYDDLKKYKPAQWNEPHGLQAETAEEKSKNYNDLGNYKPSRWNEPDGRRKPTPEEESKQYKDLDGYAAKKFDDPNTPRELSAEEKTKFYDDLGKYKPVRWNEPDGLQEPTPEEQSKNYDDVDKYGAVHWNEPDGLRKLTAEELSKNYEDLGKYGPVKWSEPDGLRPLTPEEKSKDYEDLATYKQPFVAKDATIQAHEASQMDATPKAEPIPSKVESPAENLAGKYDDLGQYGPVRWNEPDGLRKLTPEEESKDYDDLHLYGSVRWDEPDGLRRLTPEERSKQYQDLPKYAPSGYTAPEVVPVRKHPEEASKEYKDLSQYKAFDNADSAAPIHPEVASKQYKDLHLYSAYSNTGPEKQFVHPEVASKQYKDLSKYPRDGFVEPNKTTHTHPEEATKFYRDLHAYNPVMHNEPDGKAAEASGVVSSGLEAYDAGEQPQAEQDAMTTAQEIRASVLRRARNNSQKLNRKLTGNYARDFPEEFSKSWSSVYSPAKKASYSRDEAIRAAEVQIQSAERAEAELGSMDESFPQEESKMEPALKRQTSKSSRFSMSPLKKAQLAADPYSMTPQGLETSYAKECGDKPPWPAMVKHYAKKPERAEDSSSSAEEPMLYKILALDSNMQSISIAETTSAVHDASSPATPAEVLMRLSNPSKFLPHFAPLQAEGYEIVSGSGDVLVFRKVRQASDKPVAEVPKARAVNPIDMMGKAPVTGNFASPTGFVNYDPVAEGTAEKPAPPFRSNIDVRKEEPVFSGGQAKKQGKKSKRSLPRRILVGTVSVAGGMYAVGVLAEYFSTGGLDGLGPKGL